MLKRKANSVEREKWQSELLQTLGRLALSLLIGAVGGLVGVAFHHSITVVNSLRAGYPWLIWCLPIAGVLIVALYKICKLYPDRGVNGIMDRERLNQPVPLRLTPVMFLSTVLTQMCGGSAGREGAALQIGGSLGSLFSQRIGAWLKLDERSQRIGILCGMSAVFSALFGTPLTAALFCVEVIRVGALPHLGLFPCLVSSLTAFFIAQPLGGERILLQAALALPLQPALILQAALLALLAGLVAILFCQVMHLGHRLYDKLGNNPYIHVVVGGVAVAGISAMLGTTAYNGAGMNLVEAAAAGDADWYAFLLKLALTALTMGAGFKGGEIVPCFAVGSTFGCTIAPLIGLDPGVGAVLGLSAVFCGVTNCPMASILLGLELCGGQGAALFVTAALVSMFISGKCSLYASQQSTEPTAYATVV